MKAKRVVLIGAQAQGKTTFFNSITKQVQKTQYEGKSCTRQIVSANSAYGQGFEIVDTPGFNSSEDQLLHVAGILAALTSGEVNRILIVTKYERDDSITKNLELVFRPINRYRQIVTLILSHWDLCPKGQEEQEQIRIKELIEKKFQISSILYFSKNQDPEHICLKLEQILHTNNQELKVTLNDSEIFLHFELLELDCNNEDLLTSHKIKILVEFRKISQLYIKFIKSLEKSNPYFVNILFETTIKIKEEANMKVEEFEKKCGEEIEKMVDKYNNNLHYLHYIEMKKSIRKELENTIILAQQRMKESESHIYNFLKKCPNCGEVWLKVIGCNGQTQCGKQVDQKNDVFLLFQPKKKVEIFKNSNNEVSYKVNDKITQSQEFLEQMIKFVQQNQFLRENLTKPQQMKMILEKIYGEKFQDLLLKQLFNGQLDNQSLLRNIENKLKEKIEPHQGIHQKSVNTKDKQKSQQKIQALRPQSSQNNFFPQQNSQQQLSSSQSIKYIQQQQQSTQQQRELQQQRYCNVQQLQKNQTAQQFYNNSNSTQDPNSKNPYNNNVNNVLNNNIPNIFLNNNSNNNLNDNQNSCQNKELKIGCGQFINWGELPPLTSEELNQLYCPELLDYFANQTKIEQEEEINWLNKAYKEILNEAIKDQQKNIVKLTLPNQNQQTSIKQI